MKSLTFVFFALLVAVGLPVGPQTKLDEEAVRRLPQAFCDA
jgi:hypothetical protein